MPQFLKNFLNGEKNLDEKELLKKQKERDIIKLDIVEEKEENHGGCGGRCTGCTCS